MIKADISSSCKMSHEIVLEIDLDDLVNYYGKNKTEVLDKMEKAGYFYNKEENQFKRK